MVLWEDNLEKCFYQACNYLEVCGNNGITLNPDKFHFAEESIEFAGFVIMKDAIHPSDKHLEAIRDFPTPANITDIRSWF